MPVGHIRQACRDSTAVYRGIRIERSADLMSTPVWQAICDGRYEVDEIRACLGVLRAGDRLLDIGAGLGIVAAVLASHTAAGRILCVEADARLIPYARRLHAENGIRNIELLNCALTVTPEAAAAFYVRTDFWCSSLDPDTGPYAQAVRVPTRTLASVLRQFRPTVVLSDIEGGEAALFGERAQDFREVRAIVIELHVRHYPDPALAAVDRIFRALSGQGFAYDPAFSTGEVVTLRRVRTP